MIMKPSWCIPFEVFNNPCYKFQTGHTHAFKKPNQNHITNHLNIHRIFSLQTRNLSIEHLCRNIIIFLYIYKQKPTPTHFLC